MEKTVILFYFSHVSENIFEQLQNANGNAHLTEDANQTMNWIQHRDQQAQLINYLNSNGVFPVR